MEKTDSIFPIAEVIVKKISGELSPGEEDFFNAWINASPRNQDLFNRITDAQNLKERNRLVREIDTAQAWGRYFQTIKHQKKEHYFRVWRYAAAFLVPVMLMTILYFYLQRDREDNKVVQQEQILPGSRNSLLVLGNGKSINLQENNLLSIEEEDGTRIVNDKKCLSYHQAESEVKGEAPKNTLIIPKGGEYNLILSDSSEIYLNSMSRLVFPVSFSKETREVYLEGEAYFKVRKDQSRPFIVNVNGIKIEVLGTTFNVNAYSDQKQIITTLVEGKVKIHLTDSPENEFILSPDDQAVFDPAGKTIQINQVDAVNYMQWVNGIYTFNDQSLGEIMRTLSRWYDFNYWFEQQDIEDITFKGGLNKYESIEPILEIIASTGKVDVTVKGKNIVFSQK